MVMTWKAIGANLRDVGLPGPARMSHAVAESCRVVVRIGLIHPGPIRNANGAGAGREMDVTRLLMGARMAGAAVARQTRHFGAEAAERDGQNENSARCPDDLIGSRCSCLALSRNGSRMLGDVQCLPVSFHRTDPLIDNFDSRACRVS
jgi:hypothetical protein